MENGHTISDRDTSQLSDTLSDLDSLSDSDSPAQQTEWLATTRKRRSTAGNRMKSMLANEEPDSDLELLFAEDENDQGFSDADDDGSDVQMDSSSDDEDDNNANADDLEGEKELEVQAKAKRAAQRKRKAQEAIPAKFRKRKTVRIDPATTESPAPASASVPASASAPRPKKKSERASWLPSAADLPTRASSRKTTRISKEQLHLQMAEREARRLKQLAQMEKKAARLEATKKPPMTQEERLVEASIVEKRNSKSLNRWEEAEKQREEERKAKLAALNQRTLKGPVVTFWSGKGQWEDVELRSLRPFVTEVEEKPRRKRERLGKGAGSKTKGTSKSQEKDMLTGGSDHKEAVGDHASGTSTTLALETTSQLGPEVKPLPLEKSIDDRPEQGGRAIETDSADAKGGVDSNYFQVTPSPDEGEKVPHTEEVSSLSEAKEANADSGTTDTMQEKPVEPSSTAEEPIQQPPSSTDPASTANGVANSPSKTAPIATTLGIPSIEPSDPAARRPKTQTPDPLAAPTSSSAAGTTKTSSALAAPAPAPALSHSPLSGADVKLPSSSEAPESNALALPPAGPLPEPSPAACPGGPFVATDVPAPMAIDQIPKPEPVEASAQPPPHDLTPAAEPERPRRDMDATRNGIIFQNFNQVALRDKNIQTQILFGRKMTKLAKSAAPPICAITNNPARYRDPKTGLPFYNACAYKELQRLYHGEYNWSRLVGAWVGSGKQAAKGVPERFLNPCREQTTTATAIGERKENEGIVYAGREP